MRRAELTVEELVAVIKANPGACALVDNDNWQLYKTNPYTSDTDADGWYEENEIARGDSPVDAGGGLLEALATICGITIEGV